MVNINIVSKVYHTACGIKAGEESLRLANIYIQMKAIHCFPEISLYAY